MEWGKGRGDVYRYHFIVNDIIIIIIIVIIIVITIIIISHLFSLAFAFLFFVIFCLLDEIKIKFILLFTLYTFINFYEQIIIELKQSP